MKHHQSSSWFRRRGMHSRAIALLLIAGVSSASASPIQWLASGTNSTWATGANWAGGVAPANSLTTNIAGFDQTSYAFQPNAGTTSINGLQIGDGTTATAALTISGANLSTGSGGIVLSPNAGAVTISSPVTIGAAQTWVNNSASTLNVTGAIATGTIGVTISGTGNISIASISGSAGVVMSGGGLLTVNNTLGTTGELFRVTSGSAFLKSARNMSANVEVDGGFLMINGSDRFSTGVNRQTLVVTGGTFSYQASGGYGVRLNGDNGDNGNGNANVTFTANQSGGVVAVSGGGTGQFMMGNTSGTDTTTYNLSGGIFSITNGSSWSIGSDTAGTSVTAFNLNGGKLLVASTMTGAQGAGARQAFVWTSGTLAAATYNATNLTSGTGIPVSATSNTLTNGGGVLSPGDSATPGLMTITGNYVVTSTAAVLAIDIGGPTAATAFQDTATKYDTIVATGSVALNGQLAISLTNNYAPTSGNSFTILAGSALAGGFQNVAWGARMTTTDGLGSFIVNRVGNTVILNNFLWLGSAPAITTQPQSTTVLTGHSATFTVVATGSAPFTYQWYKNASAITSGTLPWFTIGSAGSGDAASYYAVVSNAMGSATTNTVSLAVNALSSVYGQLQYDMDQAPVSGSGAIIDSCGTTQGTLMGSPAPLLIPGATSYTGSAWNYSIGNGYIQVAPNSFLNKLGDISQTTGMTVGFWVNLLYQGGGSMDNSQTYGLGSVAGAATPNISDPELMFNFGAGSAASITTPLKPAVLDGNWHHVVATIDFQKHTNNMAVYIDGTSNFGGSVASVPVKASFNVPGTALGIGALNSGGHGWVGSLDQFVIYDRALVGPEVAQLYTSGTVATPAPQVAVGADNTMIQMPTSGSPSSGIYATVTPLVNGTWTKISGPAAVIASATSAATSVSLTGGTGAYTFRYTVTSSGMTNYGELVISVAANQAPVVNSCVASPALLSDTAGAQVVTLSALATDDGYPNPPGLLTSTWSQLSGPASVTIAYPGAVSTAATIPAVDGTYVMKYYVTDGALSSSSTVAISVVSNFAPSVTASADAQAIIWSGTGAATTLRAAVTDDGRPLSPGTLTATWTQISGPATATLATPSSTGSNNGTFAAACPATLPAIGQYVFQCVASDGVLTATTTTWITVWAAGNPSVYAGCSRCLWLPNGTLTLNGTCGATGAVSYQWSVARGPAAVTFSNSTALVTSATFTASGKYRLLLTASSGGFVNSDDVIVEVYDATQNFGFSATYLNNYFTADSGLHHDTTNLNWARIAPPPPAYIHPRILFNPDDLPDLRARLATTTVCGPIIMGNIRGGASQVTSGTGVYNGIYNDLVGGSMVQFNANASSQTAVVQAIQYESFRCLIDNDAAGAAKAAAAITTLASWLAHNVIPPLLSATSTTSWQYTVSGPAFGDSIAWCYDFIYNYMTPAQQSAVRSFISLITNNMWEVGLDRPPGYQCNDTNHIALTGQSLLFSSLAIEGETGWDPDLTARYEALHDRMGDSYGGPDGALYEGMGKGWIGAEAFLATAKRGSNAIASDMVRNHLRQFYPQCMETTGFGWTWEEVIGGSGLTAKFPDVIVMKYLYPADPVIDFMYRNACGPNYTANPQFGFASDFFSNLLLTAICATDYSSMSQTWDQAMASQIAPNVPLSQLFNQHGLIVTRSDWSANALRLMFQPRSEQGGHSIPDRNNIVLSGVGRIWVPWDIYGTGAGYVGGDASMAASVVRVDDTGSSVMPAAVIDYQDTPNFTYSAGDAKDCYSKVPTGNSTLASYTPNSKVLNQVAEPWMNQPWAGTPDWETGNSDTNYCTVKRNVQKAFRTACLVRGGTASPYSIIVDDIQMDTAVHNYKWRIMLANDLTNVTVTGSDAIVTSATGGNVSMLVRVLSCSGSASFLTNNTYSYFSWPWLDIQSNTVAPDFKVLMLPYVNGTPLPTTTWYGNVLYVTWQGGQEEHILFTPNPDGRTRVSFTRTTAGSGSAPVIAPQSNIVVTATGAQGNVMNFTLSATDAIDGSVPVTCNPPSGSLFPIGTTTVQASAVDSALNGSGTTFTVTVQPGSYGLTAPVASAAGGSQSVAVSWTAVAPALSYNVLRSTTSGTGFATVATGVVGTTYADPGLANGTTYYYEVQAVNDAGTGPVSNQVSAIPSPLPIGWSAQNIGSVGVTGSAAIATTGTAVITGAGNSIAGTNDSLYFASQPWVGDGVMVARILSMQNAINSSQSGLMFRQSLAANAIDAYEGCQYYASGYYFSYRATTGGATTVGSQTHASLPQWFKLVKSGTSIMGYEAVDSLPGLQTWVQTGSANIAMTGTIYAGFAVMSSNTNSLCTVTFDSFGIYTPPTIQSVANIVQPATDATGSVVDYTITGTSNVDGQITALCSPPSGSTFPVGTSTVTAVVTDGAAQSATTTFTVTILPLPPVITSTLSASGSAWTSFSYQITATGSATGYGATGLPAGLGVDTSSGIISGTPATGGTFQSTISATNAGGTGSATLTFVFAFPPPTITAAPAFNGVVYNAAIATGSANANGAPTSAYFQYGPTVSYGSQSASQPIGSATSAVAVSATFTGLAASTTYHCQLVAANSSGTTYSSDQTFTTPIAPPAITSALTLTGTVGSACSYQIGATNSPTGYNAAGLPAGLSVNTTTGVISGTPVSTGTTSVTISAANISGTGSATLVITVQPPPPVITSGLTATGTNGTPFSYQVTATNSPGSYGATGLPAGLSINAASGLINGTPTVTGTVSIVISAANISGTGTATLVLTLLPPPPVIQGSLTATGIIGSPMTYQIVASSSPASYAATGLPDGLSINTANGLISGTPSATGTTSATISASNAGGTGSATLAVVVLQPAPVITSATSAACNVGAAFSYQITATNNPAGYNATGLPSGLGINTNTGLISGTATAAGAASVSITASNAAGTGTATLALVVQPPVVYWSASAPSTAWATGSDWVGAAAPANSLATNVAGFDQTSYLNQPNAGTTNIAGLLVGDGATATAPLTLAGTSLSLGGAGITMAANSGTTTISSPVSIGAPQAWINYSTSPLIASGAIATGSNALAIGGAGPVTVGSVSGTAGLVMSGAGTLILNSQLTTAGQSIRLTSGTTILNSGRNTAANIEVDGGTLVIGGSSSGNRYSNATNQATFVVTGGLVTYTTNGGYGIRLNGDNGSASASGTGVTFTALQTGGTVAINGGGNGNFNLGNSSANDSSTYTLTGSSVLSISASNNWSLGADTAGTSVTAFYLSGGKLLVGAGMSGAQGAGARQAFVWTGGTLAASAYTATNLTSGTGIAVSATSNTLTNAGGTLAPGDIGTPGKTTITGNYSVASGSAALAIDIGGPTAAAVFQDSASKYDYVSVTGTATLGGSLSVTLTNSYVPSGSGTFTILSAASLSGSFANVAFGSRITTSDGLGTFLVSKAGNTVTLTSFIQTGPLPAVTSLAATSITGAGATLNGSVNANGNSTAVSFDYGLTTAYGSNIAGTPTPVTGTSPVAVSAAVTGLSPGTTYHFRAGGVSSAGGGYGGDLVFTTIPAAPSITSALSASGSSGAAFVYQITASNGPTSYNAGGLPAGLAVDSFSGIITGTPSTGGTFFSTVTASNAGGTGSATVTIVIAQGMGGMISTRRLTGPHTLSISERLLTTPKFAGMPWTFAGLSANGKAYLAVTLAAHGRFTGVLDYAAKGRRTLKGTLDSTGLYSGTAFAIQVTGSTPGTYLLTGSAAGEAITAYPAAYIPGAAFPEAGTYNILLNSGSSNVSSYAVLNINPTGGARITGKLYDGASIAASTIVVAGTAGREVILYDRALYRDGTGLLSGVLRVGSGVVGGAVLWQKPAGMDTRYPAGIDTILTGAGARWLKATGIPFSTGTIQLSGGFLMSPVLQGFSVTGAGAVMLTGTNASDAKLRFDSATGAITGSFKVEKIDVPFSGLLLQDGTNSYGEGYFLSPTISGSAAPSGGFDLP